MESSPSLLLANRDKMSGACYSQDEIEQKRLCALRRKAEKEAKGRLVAGSSQNNFVTSLDQNMVNKFFASTPPKQPLVTRNETSCDTSQNECGNSSLGPIRNSKSYADNRTNPIQPKTFFGSTKSTLGVCSMISEYRFIVDIDYNAKLVDIFKTVPSKSFDQKLRRWTFLLSDHETLLTACKPLRPSIIIVEIPRYILETFRRNPRSKTVADQIDISKIDNELTKSLLPYQKEGICYGISKSGRCFIADDMGLGKTIQALGIAHYYKENWPLLIVTPSSVRYQWSEAIFKFLPSVPTQYVHHFASGKDFLGNDKITIVSYDLLVRSIDVFQRHTYGFVILDESHTVKSIKTARTKAVKAITSQARHVILLSGTPALSRPLELYSQISLIIPSFMPFHDYGRRYCDAQKKHFGWDYSGSSNMKELHLLLKVTCLIRRLKTDVLKELPSKIREVVILDPTLIKKASKEAKKIAEKLEKPSELKNFEKEKAILEYYHNSCDQRITAVCNYVSDLVENGHKFLIYAHHQIVLDSISTLLDKKDIRYIRIDGKTLPEQRKFQVDQFQDSEECLVAVLSITAANAGITLTAARLVVFAELFWNPGILCQAEDRVHRIGQENSVLIRYLVAKGTVDDHLWPLIQKKISVLTKVGLDQDFSLNKANVSEQKTNAKLTPPSKKGQSLMDSFITISPSRSSQELSNHKTPEKKTIPQTFGNFENLLELDDDDFADFDFDKVS